MKCHIRQLAARIDAPELYFFSFSSPHFIWIFFPCTFFIDLHPLIYFTTQEIKLLPTPICAHRVAWVQKYSTHTQAGALMPWVATRSLNATRLRDASYQKIRLVNAPPDVKYLFQSVKKPQHMQAHEFTLPSTVLDARGRRFKTSESKQQRKQTQLSQTVHCVLLISVTGQQNGLLTLTTSNF